MMEADDKILKKFFAENKQEIADNGFTRRVMHRLPDRSYRLANILTAICMAVAIVVFIVSDGLMAIVGILREIFVSIVQNNAATFDYRALIVAGVVLLFFGIKKIYSME